ncbi:Mutator protein MutT [Legionella waltersii]|uniref:8-oxo-dGTP diphosphatase n=1 Tax=Legionella waltersii TaxID=66969 RepID=A0A0W1A185_9GAMM|nr:8-oxo-dGTP diphosphatase MutT [Legionella waltersii]KTD75132.1 Mutator protein MutT [Legionella waltersii]SNV04900.1 mutator MutT protein [Legionella waltersii]
MKVAVAVLVDNQQRILITQRPLQASHGGFWEFPGGKLEPGELAEEALIREVKEEVGIDVQEYHYLGDVHHTYPDKSVQLMVFLVMAFSGNPVCKEGQLDMKWIRFNELNPDDFPEANHAVLTMIQKNQLF